jgi:hypothetical protein
LQPVMTKLLRLILLLSSLLESSYGSDNMSTHPILFELF